MIGIGFALAILAGAALAVPYVMYALRTRARNRAFAVGLVVAALVYVGFAIARGSPRDALVETGGVALFAVFVFLGRLSVHFLALGWAVHVAWDLLLHPVRESSYAPWWYPVICIGFDLLVAGAIVGAAGKERKAA